MLKNALQVFGNLAALAMLFGAIAGWAWVLAPLAK